MKLSLISAPTNDLLRAKKRVGERRGKGQTKDREGQKHSQHIFSSLRASEGGAEGLGGVRWGGVPIIQLLTAVTG